MTLFVVGNYVPAVATELAALADGGHEIGSHGPDHGRLPEDPAALLDWLRRGRRIAEDAVQRPVNGFRSPRFWLSSASSCIRFALCASTASGWRAHRGARTSYVPLRLLNIAN